MSTYLSAVLAPLVASEYEEQVLLLQQQSPERIERYV